MPQRIEKDLALSQLQRQRATSTEACLMCAVHKGHIESGPELFRQGAARAFLSRYPVRWGHVLVVPDAHIERFSDLPLAVWRDCNDLALRTARSLERRFEPARVYVASLGAAAPLLSTCPHLHVHVVPVQDRDERPSQVLTWENGIYVGTDAEWTALETALRHADSIA